MELQHLAQLATLPSLPQPPVIISAAGTAAALQAAQQAIAMALKVDAADAPPALVPASQALAAAVAAVKDEEEPGNNGNGSQHESKDEEDNSAAHRAPGVISGKKPPAMVTIGAKKNVVFGKGIILMPDSTDLYADGKYDQVRERLHKDGFVLVRNVVPKATVTGCRSTIISHLKSKGVVKKSSGGNDALMKDDKESRKGWTVDAESGGVVGDRDPEEDGHVGWAKVGNAKEVTDVYNGDAIKTFYKNVFGSKLLADGGKIKPLPNCTWLRMKGAGELTIEHCDYFYFKGNTQIFWENRDESLVALDQRKEDDVAANMCRVCEDSKDEDQTVLCDLCSDPYHFYCVKPALKELPEGEWHCPQCSNSPFDVYTCWTALGDVTYTDGTLCMFPGSHKLLGYERPIDNELPRAWDKVSKSVVWQTCEMGPGDVVIFNIKTIHAATKNTSSKFRISCDTRVAASRFIPAKENLRETGIRKPDDKSAEPLDDDELIARRKDRALMGRMSMGGKRSKKKKSDDDDVVVGADGSVEDAPAAASDDKEKKSKGRGRPKKSAKATDDAEASGDDDDIEEVVAAVAAATKPKERRTSASRKAAAAAEENKDNESKEAAPKKKRGGGRKKKTDDKSDAKVDNGDSKRDSNSNGNGAAAAAPAASSSSSTTATATVTATPVDTTKEEIVSISGMPYTPIIFPKKKGAGGARKGAGKKKGSTKGKPANPAKKKRTRSDDAPSAAAAAAAAKDGDAKVETKEGETTAAAAVASTDDNEKEGNNSPKKKAKKGSKKASSDKDDSKKDDDDIADTPRARRSAATKASEAIDSSKRKSRRD